MTNTAAYILFLYVSILQVGVCIQMSSFNLSRIVIITPFYMLANQTSLELEVGEVPGENHSSPKRWHYIGSKEVNKAAPMFMCVLCTVNGI